MLYEYPPTDLKIPFSAELSLPPLIPMSQKFREDGLSCPEENLRQQLAPFLSQRADLQGKRIAITVGSRGIPSLKEMVRTMGEVLRAAGLDRLIKFE